VTIIFDFLNENTRRETKTKDTMDDEAPNANLITNPDHVSDKDTPVVDSPNDAAATAVKTNADVASPRCAESAIITKANCPSRFSLWYALTIFSAVSLIAHCTETKTWLVEEKWVLSATVMSLLLSCIGCMAHIVMRDNFVGMPLEGLLVRVYRIECVRSMLVRIFFHSNLSD